MTSQQLLEPPDVPCPTLTCSVPEMKECVGCDLLFILNKERSENVQRPVYVVMNGDGEITRKWSLFSAVCNQCGSKSKEIDQGPELKNEHADTIVCPECQRTFEWLEEAEVGDDNSMVYVNDADNTFWNLDFNHDFCDECVQKQKSGYQANFGEGTGVSPISSAEDSGDENVILMDGGELSSLKNDTSRQMADIRKRLAGREDTSDENLKLKKVVQILKSKIASVETDIKMRAKEITCGGCERPFVYSGEQKLNDDTFDTDNILRFIHTTADKKENFFWTVHQSATANNFLCDECAERHDDERSFDDGNAVVPRVDQEDEPPKETFKERLRSVIGMRQPSRQMEARVKICYECGRVFNHLPNSTALFGHPMYMFSGDREGVSDSFWTMDTCVGVKGSCDDCAQKKVQQGCKELINTYIDKTSDELQRGGKRKLSPSGTHPAESTAVDVSAKKRRVRVIQVPSFKANFDTQRNRFIRHMMPCSQIFKPKDVYCWGCRMFFFQCPPLPSRKVLFVHIDVFDNKFHWGDDDAKIETFTFCNDCSVYRDHHFDCEVKRCPICHEYYRKMFGGDVWSRFGDGPELTIQRWTDDQTHECDACGGCDAR